MRCPRVSSADIDGKESAELQLWSHVYRYSLMLWSFWAFKYFFELFCGNNWNNNTFHFRLFLIYTGSYTAISAIAPSGWKNEGKRRPDSLTSQQIKN